MPGTYDPNQPVIKIQHLQTNMQVITSKQRPRKLSIFGQFRHILAVNSVTMAHGRRHRTIHTQLPVHTKPTTDHSIISIIYLYSKYVTKGEIGKTSTLKQYTLKEHASAVEK